MAHQKILSFKEPTVAIRGFSQGEVYSSRPFTEENNQNYFPQDISVKCLLLIGGTLIKGKTKRQKQSCGQVVPTSFPSRGQ
ncbi:hypothetical protein POPTR_004G068650v4 [Populus trichocarpa]|uniref:Uncharacterized protein n=1 Tax=Populus trichocarpa TaxID=3694 RepID=A0ACC0T394_POPTR|nr:hypothetical protein POPTR_004G068650v4 [Populus trichocarpa]